MSLPVAIVGGGASGALLALQLASRSIPSMVIDRDGNFARGVAYSASAPWHRLNVPIEKMGGWSADEHANDFQRWYEAQHGPFGATFAARYVPRKAYGDWLHGELQASAASGVVTLRTAEVMGLVAGPQDVRLDLAGAPAVSARLAVLCFGNQPPRAIAVPGAPRVIEDMWAHAAMDPIEKSDAVLIVGTGATGIDALLELHHRGHTGPVTMLSRRALMPLVDTKPAPYVTDQPLAADRPPLSRLVRRLRREADVAVRSGRTWQSMIDAVRSELTGLWPHLTLVEQQRFVRHLRAYWLVHRHRLAPDIATLVEKLKRKGQLVLMQGRLAGLQAQAEQVQADIVVPGGVHLDLQADWVVNCTGPSGDLSKAPVPLLRALLEAGFARPSALGVGLDVDGDARLRDANGNAHPRVFVLGNATWPRFGEVTSAPQIRRRASVLTNAITRVLSGSEGAS